MTRPNDPRWKVAAGFGLDADEERLFEALLLIAENDGDAYRARDAKTAVMKAWRAWKEETDTNLREDYRTIFPKVVKALEARWARESRERRMA